MYLDIVLSLNNISHTYNVSQMFIVVNTSSAKSIKIKLDLINKDIVVAD